MQLPISGGLLNLQFSVAVIQILVVVFVGKVAGEFAPLCLKGVGHKLEEDQVEYQVFVFGSIQGFLDVVEHGEL